jgi:hypothetical protein
VHSDRRLTIRAMAVQLNLDKETMNKAWTVAQRLDSPPWQCSSSQATLSSSFWPKNRSLKRYTQPIFLIWLKMTSVLKNKICLKGWRFQDIEGIKKSEYGPESYSTTGIPKMFPTVGLSAWLLKGVLWRWPLSVRCKYTGTRLAVK